MSFRELRDLTEQMKSLGYPRLVSVDNFRTPNFELVADMLYWLVHRYDPSADLSDDISTEDSRVDFLKAVGVFLSSRAHIKLSLKSLYRADGYAVKELLKVSRLLYRATKTESAHKSELDESSTVEKEASMSAKLDELRQGRNQGQDIVDMGGQLFQELAEEHTTRKHRDDALRFLEQISYNLESDDPHKKIEKSIREKLNAITDDVSNFSRNCDDLEAEKTKIEAKIERKRAELERAEKRMKSLNKVKPAFMEEYEGLEAELRQVHAVYLERFRNLQYLETELALYHQRELEQKRNTERKLDKVRQRLKKQDLAALRGDVKQDEDDIGFDDSGNSSDEGPGRRRQVMARPRGATHAGRSNQPKFGRNMRTGVEGSMMPESDGSDSDDTSSSGADTHSDSESSDASVVKRSRGGGHRSSPERSDRDRADNNDNNGRRDSHDNNVEDSSDFSESSSDDARSRSSSVSSDGSRIGVDSPGDDSDSASGSDSDF